MSLLPMTWFTSQIFYQKKWERWLSLYETTICKQFILNGNNFYPIVDIFFFITGNPYSFYHLTVFFLTNYNLLLKLCYFILV